MPFYNCKALNANGQVVKSRFEESSKVDCIKRLKKNGLTPISVKKVITINFGGEATKERRNLKPGESAIRKPKSTSTTTRGKIVNTLNTNIDIKGRVRKISSKDLRVFTQNFYLLKKANFNNIHALQTVIGTTENPKLAAILEDILAGVEAGEYMYTTMEYYSNVFPYIYINMIKVGELSGTLEQSLEQAVEYLESSDTLRKRVQKILIPNILMFVAIVLLTFIAVFVGVPLLKNIFESVGSTAELPAITMAVYNFTIWFRSIWYIPVAIIAVIAVGIWLWLRTTSGRYRFDHFKYTMPIFGKLIYLLDFSRLMQGVLLNLKSGMRIQDALDVSKNVIKNTYMISLVESAINNIYIGQSWITPFEESNLGDSMCFEMLKIGMQTDLAEMIEKMLDYVEQDIDNTLDRIVKVLPEISYIFVGVVLIFFVCAVLVPCIQVYMGSWLFSAYESYF